MFIQTLGLLEVVDQSVFMEDLEVFCYCDKPLVVKTIYFGENVGRRYKACAAKECHYDEWIDIPLCIRGRAAVEELAAENSRLHSYYGRKLDRLKKESWMKQRSVLSKLKEVHVEIVREDPDSGGDDV